MAWYEFNIVTQRPQALFNAVDQRLMIASGEIGASDGTLEQDITDNGDSITFVKKDHMARRVARAVQDIELLLANGDAVTLIQPSVGFEYLGGGEPEHLALFRHCLDPEPVLFMWTFDYQAPSSGQFTYATGMIDMRVGNQNLFQLQTLILDHLEYLIQVAAWIYHRGFLAFLTPQQGAVLFKGGDGDDGKFHCFSVFLVRAIQEYNRYLLVTDRH
jgi:hypothetical protein